MNPEQLAALPDEELLREAKKIKSAYVTSAAVLGLLAGVAIYSIFNKGLGWPLIFIAILMGGAVKNGKDYKAVKQLLKERNLKP
jgi:hypothetical protein